jgi:hypothetical protein
MRRVTLLCSFVLLSLVARSQVTVNSFEGIDAASVSGASSNTGPNGAAGTKQYLEWVNPVYQAYDKKTFAPVYASPVQGDQPWRSAGMSDCYGNSRGDVVVLFDRLASRWVIGRSQGRSNYFYCIAVSNTDDLTASTFAWRTYELSLNSLLGQNSNGHTYFPDYSRFATWTDGYYISIDLEDPDNAFAEVGTLVCAFDRTNMLQGKAARAPQCFRYPTNPSGLFLGHSLLPADFEGTILPPNGTPEYYVSIENPAGTSTTSTTLNFWQLHVDWGTPANTTFTGPLALPYNPYTPGCYNATKPSQTVCVPEPSTSSTKNHIDSIGDRLMHRFAYRDFANYQSYVVTQTVMVGPGKRTGILWYEFRAGGGLISSGLINPADKNYRFVPSAAQDKNGDLAIGYSVSGNGLHPSIRASYLNLPSASSPTEIKIFAGSADEENSQRWAGYTSMTIDPVDDCTFWYVNQYFTVNQTGSSVTWQTRISNFTIPTCQ